LANITDAPSLGQVHLSRDLDYSNNGVEK